MISHWGRSLIAVLLLGIAPLIAAQDYPNRPIRLVNPSAPGGSSDPILRLLGQKLLEGWGQPLVIESHPGAATGIGTEIATRATPDGYTWLMGSSSMAINPSVYPKLTYDAQRDLAPIIMLTLSPNVLAVHQSVPVKSVAELIAYARANPGKLSYGSSGNGATNHLAMELFKAMAKIDLVHIPYKTGGAAVNDLLGGQVQVLFNPASSLVPHEKSGRIRLLAVTSPNRVAGLDLPTMSEAGLTGFESNVWYGFFAPARTPRPIIDRINAEVNRILKEKSVSDQLQSAGHVPVGGTPEDLGDYLRRDTAKWARVVKESGTKID